MLTAGETEALAIMMLSDDETSLDVTNEAQYESSDLNIATVNASGVVTAVAGGNANISVSYGSFTLDVPVIVTPSSQLDSISAYLASNPLYVGSSTNLIVIADFDGVAVEVTARATFEFEYPELAKIDANGFITALKPGITEIKVKFLSEEYYIEGFTIR